MYQSQSNVKTKTSIANQERLDKAGNGLEVTLWKNLFSLRVALSWSFVALRVDLACHPGIG